MKLLAWLDCDPSINMDKNNRGQIRLETEDGASRKAELM